MTKTANIEAYRRQIRRTLEAAEQISPVAHSVALMMLDSDLTLDEILTAVKKIPASTSDSVHYRGGAIYGDASAMARKPAAPEGDGRTAAQIALGDQIGAIAKGAASARVVNEQIRFHNGDELDQALARAGARAAEKLRGLAK
jgi:hypothetical protein